MTGLPPRNADLAPRNTDLAPRNTDFAPRNADLARRNADLDPRRKRILFRAWHRGTREMDLLMGRYAESVIEALDEGAMSDFETLIEVSDRDLFSWIARGEPVPFDHDTPVFQALKAFHSHDKPLDL